MIDHCGQVVLQMEDKDYVFGGVEATNPSPDILFSSHQILSPLYFPWFLYFLAHFLNKYSVHSKVVITFSFLEITKIICFIFVVTSKALKCRSTK